MLGRYQMSELVKDIEVGDLPAMFEAAADAGNEGRETQVHQDARLAGRIGLALGSAESFAAD